MGFLAIMATAAYAFGTVYGLMVLQGLADSAEMQGEAPFAAFLESVYQGMLVFFVVSAVALLAGIKAPYGRYQSNQWAFGLPFPGRISWILQEAPCVVAVAAAVVKHDGDIGFDAKTILLSMFFLHYINRTLIFPFRLTGGKPTTAMAFFLAMGFCVINGTLQAKCLTENIYEYPSMSDARFLCGVVVWIFGAAVNLQSDSILINLRKDRPGDKGYYIPHGGFFRFISCPNFFGEIVEWFGFALASGFAPHATTFAICTLCNLFPRALQHHAFYVEKFKGEYPGGRRAVIPFVW
eukprot:g1476.t1